MPYILLFLTKCNSNQTATSGTFLLLLLFLAALLKQLSEGNCERFAKAKTHYDEFKQDSLSQRLQRPCGRKRIGCKDGREASACAIPAKESVVEPLPRFRFMCSYMKGSCISYSLPPFTLCVCVCVSKCVSVGRMCNCLAVFSPCRCVHMQLCGSLHQCSCQIVASFV